jgi:hypothetical protein
LIFNNICARTSFDGAKVYLFSELSTSLSKNQHKKGKIGELKPSTAPNGRRESQIVTPTLQRNKNDKKFGGTASLFNFF